MKLLEEESAREKVINKIISKENDIIKAKNMLRDFIKEGRFDTYDGTLTSILEIGKMEYTLETLSELRIEILQVFDRGETNDK